MLHPPFPAGSEQALTDLLHAAVAAPALADIVAQVIGGCERPARILVFGGVLRNAVLADYVDRPLPMRDADFVAFGLATDDALAACFASRPHHANSFGGLKLQVSGVAVDIWRAELQLRIAGQPAATATLDDFLDCVTLTTDAVLYDPLTRTVHQRGFLRAMERREIDLGKRSRWLAPWLSLHLAHLAYVRELTGFALSDAVAARVRETASPEQVTGAIAYLARRHKVTDPAGAVRALIAAAAP